MKSKDWKPGDIVMNVETRETAHFYQQIGFDNGYVIVLPRGGKEAGDEDYWPVKLTKRVGPFPKLEVLK